MLRLPRTFGSRNDKPRINEIATAFSKPRNDGVGVLSLRGVKRRSNPQTTILLFINRKIKEFTTLCHICYCEGQRPVAIHKPLIINTKTENKKKSLLFIKLKN